MEPLTPSLKLATKCSHLDKPEKARGMCQSCYRALKRAEEVESGVVKVDEETGADARTGGGVEMDFVSDPQAIKQFYKLMWQWMLDGEGGEPIIVQGKGGKMVRDFKLETRMQEMALAKKTKAATILGRAYIAERHVEEKPSELPVEGMGDMMKGWGKVEQMASSLSSKGKNTDA